MDADWVKLCPFIEFVPPHPLYSHREEDLKEVLEIRDFFKEKNSDDFMIPFLEHFSRLPMIPENGTKMEQILKSIRLMKIANNVNAALQNMGIK